MAAKNVSVSNDDTTYYTLPGSSADLSEDSATTDDSIFGTTFSSSQATLITWSATANGYFKGFPGYRATLKRTGTSTSFTAEATTQKDGLYYITDRTKSIFDKSVPLVVNDGASAVASSNIEYIDWLQGGVKFVSTYTPTGTITFDSGSYFPTSPICYAQTFTLTQSADTENITNLCEAQANGGYGVFSYNQQSAELSLDGFFNEASDFSADLNSRDTVIIEVNPDGNGESVARGYFMATNRSQSGDVGSTESESVTYTLQVPEGVVKPFSWYHSSTTSIPTAVKTILDAWEDRAELFFRYAPEGATNRRNGKVLVADCSLSSGVEDVAEFSFDFTGTGELATTAI